MQNLKQFIIRSSQNWNETNELELRVGTFNGKRFIPGITQKHFFAVKRMFFKENIHEEIIDTIYTNDPVRARNDVYLLKETKQYSNFPELGVRMSYNTETILPKHQFTTPIKMVRHKLRWSIEILNWRVDLTQINGNSYELEIELTKPSEHSYENLLKVLFKVNPVIFYYLMTGTTKFIGNQPKTLELKDIATIKTQGYSVTDKADGLRQLLLITEFGSVMFDKHLRYIHYDTQKMVSLTGTLLDGEYINDMFYAFDIIYFQRKNIMQLNLNERLQYLNTVPIDIKTFHMDLDGIHTIRDTEHPYSLDGLIFTPINEGYYGPVYKWKDNITIDVLYKNGKFYTRDKTLLVDIETLGITCKEMKWYWENNCILELQPKKDTNEYTVLTERFDKTEPNALLTVKSAIRATKQNIDIYNLNQFV